MPDGNLSVAELEEATRREQAGTGRVAEIVKKGAAHPAAQRVKRNVNGTAMVQNPFAPNAKLHV